VSAFIKPPHLVPTRVSIVCQTFVTQSVKCKRRLYLQHDSKPIAPVMSERNLHHKDVCCPTKGFRACVTSVAHIHLAFPDRGEDPQSSHKVRLAVSECLFSTEWRAVQPGYNGSYRLEHITHRLSYKGHNTPCSCCKGEPQTYIWVSTLHDSRTDRIVYHRLSSITH
jgi:hypothetical protein